MNQDENSPLITNNQLLSSNPVNETIDRIGFGKYQIFLILGLIEISFAVGRDIVIHSIIAYILQNEWNLSSLQLAFLGSCSLCGMGIGYIVALILQKPLNRINILKTAALILIATQTALVFSFEIISFCILRFLTGISIGLSNSLISISVAEVTPSTIRGKITLLMTGASFSGLVIMAALMWIFVPDLQGESWRVALGVFDVFTILMVILLFLNAVESPLYLVRRGNLEKGIQNLNYIANKNNSVGVSQTEKQSIQLVPKLDHTQFYEKISGLFDKKHFFVSIKLVGLWTLTLIGTYSILYTLPFVLDQEYDFQSILNLYYFIIGLSTVSMILLGIYLVDKQIIGRKKLLIYLSIVNLIFMTISSIFKEVLLLVVILMVAISSFQTVNVGLMYLMTAQFLQSDLRVAGVVTGNFIGRGIGASTCIYVVFQLYQVDFIAMMGTLAGLQLLTILIALALPYDTTGMKLDTQQDLKVN